MFYDGDVSILINPDIYNLHASVLENKSRLFKVVCARSNEPGQLGMTRLTLVPSAVHDRGVLESQVSL